MKIFSIPYPRWGPLPDDDILWIAFSSIREYPLVEEHGEQIWVSGINPELAYDGLDPSTKSFLVARTRKQREQSHSCLVESIIMSSKNHYPLLSNLPLYLEIFVMLILLPTLIFACKSTSSVAVEDIDLTDYSRLQDGVAWTYRDDENAGDTENIPSEEDLLRAHGYEGDAEAEDEGSDYFTIEFRRGERWVDGIEYGFMQLHLSEEQLEMWSFDLSGTTSQDILPLAHISPIENPTVSNGSWSCTTTPIEEQWTWYGTFQNVLEVVCQGGPLAGVYVLGSQAGFISITLDDADIDLQLVAPW